jgi:signal transduction histidine kinase
MSKPLSLRDAVRATSRPEAYLSIRTKGLLLIAGPVILQLVFVGMLFSAQRSAAEAEARAAHSGVVMQHAAALQTMVLEAVSRMRAAVITGVPAPDDRPDATAPSILAAVDDLRRLVDDNAAQARRADAARTAAVALEDWLGGQYRLLDGGGQAEAAGRVRAGEGATRLNAVREQLRALLAEEARLDEARRAALASARAEERQFLIAAFATGTLVAAFVAWIFARGIGTRLGAVSRNADRLAQGLPLEPPVAGRDEIAALDDILFDAGRRLADQSEAEALHKQQLESRASELARVNAELERTVRDNEMFVYSVSHDLRSPLVNLQGFGKELSRSCDELRLTLADPSIPKQARAEALAIVERDFLESIRFIRIAVSRAASIIDALLQLSRAGRVEYRPRDVFLSEVVSRVLDAMRTTIAERGARVLVHRLDTVHGDPTALEQIVANLVGNAVNYLDPTRPGRIDIETVPRVPAGAVGPSPERWSHEAYSILAVRDNGSGIPASHLPKIFVAFQRLEPGKAEGEGIGLTLVRRMVERHGGAIWVESTEGIGSTFFVALPVRAGVPVAEVADTAAVGG